MTKKTPRAAWEALGYAIFTAAGIYVGLLLKAASILAGGGQ